MYNVPAEVADQQSAQVSTSVRPNNGTLFPAVTKPLHKGGKLVSFDIDRWGFKDDVIKVCQALCTVVSICHPCVVHATGFQIHMHCCQEELQPLQGVQDAYITITTVDGKGNMVGSSQNTPVTNNLGGNYVVFKCQV